MVFSVICSPKYFGIYQRIYYFEYRDIEDVCFANKILNSYGYLYFATT